jgi:hypothetical protein
LNEEENEEASSYGGTTLLSCSSNIERRRDVSKVLKSKVKEEATASSRLFALVGRCGLAAPTHSEKIYREAA